MHRPEPIFLIATSSPAFTAAINPFSLQCMSALHDVLRVHSKKRFKGRSMRCGYLKRVYDGRAAWGCNGKALTEARA
ncbi:hypothetical protein BB542_21015 [Escherichia coli]|nr:hypothetical protein [Escherichia coli]KHH69310.1 hypothetical protein PU54_03070 [Escherichia coli]KQJ11070.1 hypothetical protein AM265_02165 [Escherichia coli]PBU03918.1 hypothetical protein BBJ22_16125 [Escherichia coli]PBU13278.1 hypothetical protein BBJ24_16000 [Escherichia coli]